jgi:hypothetical protein
MLSAAKQSQGANEASRKKSGRFMTFSLPSPRLASKHGDRSADRRVALFKPFCAAAFSLKG